MPVDLSHIPDIELDTRSGQLIEAYLNTWQRVVHQPTAMVEFLCHLHIRTVLGLDAPLDRQAMAIANLTVFENIRDNVSRYRVARKQSEALAERRELYLEIARGDLVAIDLIDQGVAGSVEIEHGHMKVDMARLIDLSQAAWKIQIGPPIRAKKSSEAYQEVGAISPIRIVDETQQLMGGRMSWREFAVEWGAVWQRQMTRILLEPLVPVSLRQFTAAAAVVSLMMLEKIQKEFDDHTADDILPSAQCRKLWSDALAQIAEGGLVLAELANERQLVVLHFEGSEAHSGGDEAPALSIHPDLGATFCRVSEAILVSEDVQASIRDAAERSMQQPGQRTKIGRNAPVRAGVAKSTRSVAGLGTEPEAASLPSSIACETRRLVPGERPALPPPGHLQLFPV